MSTAACACTAEDSVIVVLPAPQARVERLRLRRLLAEHGFTAELQREGPSAVVRESAAAAGAPWTTRPVYRFGNVEVDPVGRRITKAGRHRSLPPRPFLTLLTLLEHGGAPVTREELLRALVSGAAPRLPGTRTIDSYVRRIRAVVEDDPGEPRHLITVQGVGYRIEGLTEPQERPRGVRMLSPQVRRLRARLGRSRAPRLVSSR